MILPSIFIGEVPGRGRGVFTKTALPKGAIVEISPVVVMSGEERKLLDQTLLHDYIFEWGEDRSECCMALGYVAVYNHDYTSNCEYEMDYKKACITIKTVRDINPGEELMVNYNGDWNDPKRVWFDTK